MKAAKPESRFIISKRFASGHQCGLIFGPGDWQSSLKVIQRWNHRGWCTSHERQLFIHEVWCELSRHKEGREWAEFMASMFKKGGSNDGC